MPADLETLGRAVKQVQYRHHRALDNRLAAVGTTLAQWDALRAIGRTPGASAHTLAVETFQSDQSFGTLANRLAAQDLITRRSGKGRRIEHHLTPAGKKVLQAGRPIAKDVFAASFAQLSERERSALLDLLLRILRGHEVEPGTH
jgi:DNA-binding MarR family transcriptional regulator